MRKLIATLISLGFAILFAVASYFMPNNTNLFWAIVICIVTFLVSFVFIELLEHIKRIEDVDLNNKYKFFKECGISQYHRDFTALDFIPSISGANNIKIVLLYSNRFLQNYINALQKFVAKEGSHLELIILTNDKNSNAYKYISKKFEYGQDKLAEKLNDFIKILKDDILPQKNSKSTIKLYCTDLIPTYTLYMFDDHAYITLYKIAPQRTNLIPCFRVETAYDSSFFHFMSEDFNDIKKRAKEFPL